MTLENNEPMETEISIESTDKETVVKPVPECLEIRNNDDKSIADNEAATLQLLLLNSPPKHVKKTTKPEEVQLLFCTANQTAAVKQGINFPRSKFTFLEPHPRNKKPFHVFCST